MTTECPFCESGDVVVDRLALWCSACGISWSPRLTGLQTTLEGAATIDATPMELDAVGSLSVMV